MFAEYITASNKNFLVSIICQDEPQPENSGQFHCLSVNITSGANEWRSGPLL